MVTINSSFKSSSSPQLLLISLSIDGHQVNGLIDTGASRSWIKANKVPLGSEVLEVKPVSASGFSSKATRISSTSRVARVTMTLVGSSTSASSVDELLILEDLVFDVILGLDWLGRHQASINLNPASLQFETFGHVPILGKATQYSSSPDSPLQLIVPSENPYVAWSDEVTAWASSSDFDDVDVDEEVSKEELKTVPPQFHCFADVFSKKRADRLPPLRKLVDLQIKTPDDLVQLMPRPRVYHTGRRESIALAEYLDDMLRKGFIEPSRSPIASSAFFVPKGTKNELRLVVDYKNLNEHTVKDKYALPLISDIFAALAKGKIFSKIDLRGAYNLMRVREEDQWKTAFITSRGTFEYKVMPFGLSNAPSAFQRWVNTIFQDLMPRQAMVYLDDIILFSENETSHGELIHEVLSRLRANRLYASPHKCEFFRDKVTYLGHVISPEGVEVCPDKIAAVQDWPPPTSVKKIQRFLGFANYSSKFLSSFAVHTKPLTRLLRDSVKASLGITRDTQEFELPPAALQAFEDIKKAFTTAPILAHWDDDRETILETDASNFAIGAILSQYHGEKLRPVAYLSRAFSPAEMNYDVHDKEMLSIIEAFRAWRHMLLGAESLIVHTDHRNLEYFHSTKTLTPRQVRWSQFLSQFRFKVVYREGQLNGRCDALSRREDHEEAAAVAATNVPQNVADELGIRRRAKPRAKIVGTLFPPDSAPGIDSASAAATRHDSTVAAVHSYSRFEIVEDELTEEIKSACRALKTKELNRLKEAPGFSVRSQDPQVLWFNGALYVPDQGSLRTRALQKHHDPPESGHWGATKTRAVLNRHYAWPGDKKEVKKFVDSCRSCNQAKPGRTHPAPLRPLELAEAPWKSISMDRITQLPLSDGYSSILVIVDRFTKMALFIPVLENFSSKDLAEVFIERVIYRFGTPTDIVSDRGPEFASQLWKDICAKLGIRVKLSTAYHPQTDGQTERVNQTLEVYLRHYVGYHQDNWSRLLPLGEFCYNTTPHSATHRFPYEVLYNYVPELRTTHITELGDTHSDLSSEELREQVKKFLKDARDSAAHHHNGKNAQLPNWEVGDQVWLSTENLRVKRPSRKLGNKFCGPFPIRKKVSTHAYQLDLPADMRIHDVFHVSLLRTSISNEFEGREIPPPPPVMVDNEEEYVVEEIIAHKPGPDGGMYRVRWKGYGEEHNSWEPRSAVENAAALDRFEAAEAGKARRRTRQRGLARR